MLTSVEPRIVAEKLARGDVSNRFKLIEKQHAATKGVETAIGVVKRSLETFRANLNNLLEDGALLRHTADVSDPTLATAATGPAAREGNFKFFLVQRASAHQIVVEGMPALSRPEGVLAIQQADGTELRLDLSKIRISGPQGQMTVTDLARGINESQAANGKLTATVAKLADGSKKLILSASQRGANSMISVTSAQLGDPSLRNAFVSNLKEWVSGQDASFRLGAANGSVISQPSNTFTGIQGLIVTFSEKAKRGDEITVSVKKDSESATQGIQKFVDAYNNLKNDIDKQGGVEIRGLGPDAKVVGGALHGDSGLRALKRELEDVIRSNVGGLTFYKLGIQSDRKGHLAFNAKTLQKTLAEQPHAVETFFSKKDVGLVPTLTKHMTKWLDGKISLISLRTKQVEGQLSVLKNKEDEVNARYEILVLKYIRDIVKLRHVREEMERTIERLNDFFSEKKKR